MQSEPVVTFEQAFHPHRNAYGFLRFALAAIVVVSHAFLCGGWDDPVWAWSGKQENLGGVAVDGFFAISGFLILRSWVHAPDVATYLWRRAARILPAYWAALLLVALGWAPLWWRLEHGSFSTDFLFGPEGALAYLRRSFWLNYEQEWGIAGLLGGLPTPTWVNAPFWTLRYEAVCYLLLAAAGTLGLLRARRPLLVTVAFFGFWLLHALESGHPHLGQEVLGFPCDEWFLRLAAFFFAGAFFYVQRDRIPIDRRIFVASVALLWFTLANGGFQTAAVIAIPYCVHYLACVLPLSRFESRGDFSYGLYVFTFPLQQTLALLFVHEGGLWLFNVASLLGGLLLAFFSYRLIEAPFLARRDARRAVETQV